MTKKGTAKATDTHSVQFPDPVWKLILNLLNEELDVWEKDSSTYALITVTIRTIEYQTGIRKKGGQR